MTFRRRLSPVYERCKVPDCTGVRRRSQDFCDGCFKRLPADMRRGIASARSEQRFVDAANLALKARDWLAGKAPGTLAEEVAREGREQRARWMDR